MRTRVGIIGAGPAGLLLSHLLHQAGVESVVLESRDREYVQNRQRAGVVEHGVAAVLRETGLGDRMDKEGFVHDGIEVRFDGHGFRVDFPELTGGRNVVIWPQTEIVKDLIARRLADGGAIEFNAKATAIEGIGTDRPRIKFQRGGSEEDLECDIVVACDGFHGIGRQSLPSDVIHTYDRIYPFSWLGILANVPPSYDELIYANHERGFALGSMRSAEVSRLYLQVPNDANPDDWSDEQIWDELSARFALRDSDWSLSRGTITDKSVTPMRSFVTEPMRYGNLFLAGDAAHIVPPTGAKGLNLAMHDVTLLSAALATYYTAGDQSGLDSYSDTALRRVWRAEHFSYWMTALLHRAGDQDAFDYKLQLSHLHFIADSRAAATQLAQNYTGLPSV